MFAHTIHLYWFILFLALTGLLPSCQTSIEPDSNTDNQTQFTMNQDTLTADQQDVKAVVEHFLIVAGNYDLTAMDSMILNNAIIGSSRIRDDKWQNSVIAFDEYLVSADNRDLQPYFEPVMH